MAISVRFLADSERLGFQKTIVQAFGHDHEPDEEMDARFNASFRNETSVAAFDDQNLVATLSSFDLELQVPGGSLPMAGTTVVSVLPTHRRRGILTNMMRMHIDQAVERRQPLAGLWATEYGIYSRFGYGPASEWREVGFDTRQTSIQPEPGIRFRMIDNDEAKIQVPPLFEAGIADRPGTYQRPDWYWQHRVFLDPKEFRGGESKQRWVLAESDDGPVGYVRYRTKLDWDNAGPIGKVNLIELIALNDSAERALWHFISTVDLFPNVTYWNCPADSVLPWIIDNPRRISHSIAEALWLRILDIPAALEGRRYQSDGSIVIGVTDSFIPDNTGSYRISVHQGVGSAEATTDSPHVEMSVDILGSLYLGTHRAQQLERANRIVGSSDSIAQLDALLKWSTPAWTEAIF